MGISEPLQFNARPAVTDIVDNINFKSFSDTSIALREWDFAVVYSYESIH